jgi:2'-hydroxyisoflavone reductase
VRVLVIGGTRFVGRHLVTAALDAGHSVTLFHRGRTGADLFLSADQPRADHLMGDRDEDLSGLAQGEWDVTLDVCAYVPRQVRVLADALGLRQRRGGRYAQISSIAAYAEPDAPGVTEKAPLAALANPENEEVTPETYGGLKALCELAAVECFGTETLIVRPTYVIGPWDPTGRFTYWVRRLARGGRVAVPGPPDQPVQTVDARDLAAWTVRLLEDGVTGALHAASQRPPFSLQDLLEQVADAVAPAGTELVWVDAATLANAGLTPRELPMWAGGGHSYYGAVDPSAALRTGLACRPVQDSARDVLRWADTPLVDGVGLAPEVEERLMSAV